jgi:hypothetical protein
MAQRVEGAALAPSDRFLANLTKFVEPNVADGGIGVSGGRADDQEAILQGAGDRHRKSLFVTGP